MTWTPGNMLSRHAPQHWPTPYVALAYSFAHKTYSLNSYEIVTELQKYEIIKYFNHENSETIK